MTLPEYLLGVVLVVTLVGTAGFAAYRLRGRFLPGWTGPPARLVESVLAIGAVVLVSELLGLVGLIRPWTLVPVFIAFAVASRLWLPPAAPTDLPNTQSAADPRRTAGGGSSVPLSPRVPASSVAVALTVAFLLVAQWGAFVAQNLDAGITNFDSVWYHMPFAAEIARTGSVTFFHHTETVFTNWFYPQNSELIHGVAISLTGHDFLSVFLNLGWLGLALLGGWCVGRPFGRPHLTMIAMAAVLATHTLVVREPGTGKNDIVAIALTVSAIAILFNRSSASKDGLGRVGPGWAVAVAGLAIGLAAGTKVTALAPAAMITCAVLVAAVHGKRLRTAGIWLGALVAGGGWWYLRNLLATGNPLPQVKQLGPIDLPGPERLQEGRPDFSVIHYVTDSGVWRDYFLPGLEKGFGTLWPLMIVLAIGGVIALIFRGPGRLTRAHGAAALVAVLAYLVTPLSAAGPEGDPTGFAINLRFLTPALAMSIVLIPLLPWFDEGRKLRSVLGILLAALFVVTWADHPLSSTSGAGFGIFLGLLTVVLPGAAWLMRKRLPSALPSAPGMAALAAAAVFILAGWPLSQGYFDDRYREFEPAAGLSGPYEWASKTADARIGLAGTTAGFKQFGFYGPDLTNRVIYLGRQAPAGGFDAIGTCDAFVRAVNAASLDYLVTSPHLNFLDYERPESSPEETWVGGDPALVPVVAGGPVKVWRVAGQLDPGRCDRLAPRDEYIPGLREAGDGQR